MAGANAMTRPNIPIAVPRFSIGKIRNIIVCNSGIISPAPDAWNTRPISNKLKLGATAATAVPNANKLIAVKNNFRVVKRSRSEERRVGKEGSGRGGGGEDRHLGADRDGADSAQRRTAAR